MTAPQEQPDGHTKGLIERLEAAAEGSAALDREVARLFGWHRVEPRIARNKHGGWIAPEDWIGRYSDGSPVFDSLHGTTIYRDPHRFTTSLDAALSLAERVLPRWIVRADIYADRAETSVESIRATLTEATPQLVSVGRSRTASLALCAAILKASHHDN